MKRSPLYEDHVALGAKLVPFGGWEMPLSYPLGTVGEHLACRNGAVAFDVSHLGTVRVQGPEAFAQLNAAFTNDLGRIAPGRAQYTHLLDESDASVLDDIIVWWVSDDTFDVMPNASNTDRVVDALRGGGVHGGKGVQASDTTSTRAVIAVQGRSSLAMLATVFPSAASVGRFRVATVDLGVCEATVAGTGYTGEAGVELAVPADNASAVWQMLMEARIVPAGLGARDTLRLEAGLPLHGHELGAGVSSLHAGLGWVVSWKKGPFRGRDALLRIKESGPDRVLRGLSVPGRRPPREGQTVHSDGRQIGVITSGNFSPVLSHGIALAMCEPSTVVGDRVEVELRGTRISAEVVPLPFVAKDGSDPTASGTTA